MEGTARSTSRLQALGLVLAHGAAPVRTGARLLGVLTFVTTAALSGTIQGGPPRLTGALSPIGLEPVAGTARSTQRALSTGMILAHGSAPIRVVPRVQGASLTIRVPLAETRGITPRLTGQLGMAGTSTALAGTTRSSARLTGALQSDIPVAGTTRVTERLTGQLTTRVPLQGSSRVVSRLIGVGPTLSGQTLQGTIRAGFALIPGVELTTTFSAAEIIAPTARISGQLTFHVAIQGSIRVTPLVRGDLTIAGGTPVAMEGTVRSIALLRGQITQVGSLAGTIQVHPRAYGQLGQRPAGFVRLVERMTGQLTTRVPLEGTMITIPRLGFGLETQPSEHLKGRHHAGPYYVGRHHAGPYYRGRRT